MVENRVGAYTFNYNDCLGSGSFATVYRGFGRGKTVAVKAVDLRRIENQPNGGRLKEHLFAEIKIMHDLRHPNIVSLEDDYVIERNTLYVFLEYCSGGDFAAYIKSAKRLSERQAHIFMGQLAEGLRYLHTKQVVHRDLKPHNLLLSDRTPSAVLKIADFGFARVLAPEALGDTVCGSPLYMAPEILFNTKHTDKADLWSTGAVLHEMVTGRPPIQVESAVQLYDRLRSTAVVALPTDIEASDSLRDLVRGLLTVNTSERISWERFLGHPWIVGTAVVPPSLSAAAAAGAFAVTTPPSRRGSQPPVFQQQQQQQQPPSGQYRSIGGIASAVQQAMMSPAQGPTQPGKRKPESSGLDSFGSLSSFESLERELDDQNGLGNSPPPPPAPDERLFSELDGWQRRASSLAELAKIRAESGYPAEALALCHWCLEISRGALLTAQRRADSEPAIREAAARPNSRVRTSVDMLVVMRTDCLSAVERYRVQLSQHSQGMQSMMVAQQAVATPERVVYLHAMSLGRAAGVDELLGRAQKAAEEYATGISLLECLLPAVTDDSDKRSLKEYIELFRARQQEALRM